MKEKINIFICRYFSKEVSTIVKSNFLVDVVVTVFPSNCGKPPLHEADYKTLAKDKNCNQNCILGSVCINNLNNSDESTFTMSYDSCFELVLNKPLVNHYISKGYYLVTPGWIINWNNEINNWGFDKETARDFFDESCSKILLLDTGIEDNIGDNLMEFSSFINKPYESIPIGLDILELNLRKAISRIEENNELEEKREVTDYAMMMDLLNDLAESLSEKEVLEKIIQLFSILFAPESLHFLSIDNDKPGNLISQPTTNNPKNINKLLDRSKKTNLSNTGFCYSLTHKDQLVGIIEIENVAFPQYLKHYKNLANSVLKICSLVISNARTYELITNQRDQLESALKKLKETQDLLIESEKMAALGNLVAGVAHEINTPVSIGITATTGFLNKVSNLQQLTKEGKLTKNTLEKTVTDFYLAGELILRNLNRTGELINSFKRVSVDETSEKPREFNLRSYISDIVASLEPQLRKKKIITSITCSKYIYMKSYPGALAQIMTNLFLNSLKHAFKVVSNNTININAKNNEGLITIEVTDNGIGIAENDISKIFDPFFTTDKQEGSGLGLHIAYNLVTQKLKGDITCRSYVGKGAKFTINIPLSIIEIE